MIRIRLWLMVAMSAVGLAGGVPHVRAAGETEPVMDASQIRDGLRVLRKRVRLPATRQAVWQAWTTSEGVGWFGPKQSRIELRVGGPYEWYFLPESPEGMRGSEGCTVLSYVPQEMLSFTWNAPPSIPALRSSGAKTHVVIELHERGPREVELTLAQVGFGEGPDWEKYYAYFDRAWPNVLRALHAYLAAQVGTETHSADGAPPDDRATKEAEEYFVYFLRPARPGFFDGPPIAAEREPLAGHVDHIRRLTEQGIVLVAGPCEDPPYYPTNSDHAVTLEMPTPGIVVFRAGNLEEARRIMEGDPAVAAGVFKARLNRMHLAFRKPCPDADQ